MTLIVDPPRENPHPTLTTLLDEAHAASREMDEYDLDSTNRASLGIHRQLVSEYVMRMRALVTYCRDSYTTIMMELAEFDREFGNDR